MGFSFISFFYYRQPVNGINCGLWCFLSICTTTLASALLLPFKNCFGGPKKQSGGLVALIQVLMKDHDRNGERAVEEIKRFSEGKSKPDPKEVVQILEKYNKHKYLGYAGCF